MKRTPLIGLALVGAAALFATATHAQTATAAPKPAAQNVQKKVAAAKPKPAASPSRQTLQAKAHAPAAALDVTETLSDNQLQLSHRVLTGSAQCEFNQSVSVDPIHEKPGHFRVAFNRDTYTMTPQETTTGAVRLEDKRNGVVWIQIPSKSMMMNHKIGQRMVDGCTHAEQRATVATAQ